MTTDTPAIETTDLTKRYRDVVAVDGLDLRVEAGEVFGFLGPNGAGKSTTIDILLDLAKPTSGQASMLGLDVADDRETVHERIGVLPESYGLYDRLTGYEHLEFVADLKDADDDPDAVLGRVGLDPADAARPAGSYSKGMGQRLALGMAVLGEPDLLVLDEPTNGLDPNGARELREVIRAENERGATVFFSSHVLEQVEAIADRVAIMDDGRLVAVDSLDGLRRDLGAGETLVFEVAGTPDLDLADLDGVTDVSVREGAVELRCLDPDAKFEAIERVRAAATVADFHVEEHSLEDLFASYTTGDPPGDAAPAESPAGGPAGGEEGGA